MTRVMTELFFVLLLPRIFEQTFFEEVNKCGFEFQGLQIRKIQFFTHEMIIQNKISKKTFLLLSNFEQNIFIQ